VDNKRSEREFREVKKVLRAVGLPNPTTSPQGIAEYRKFERRLERLEFSDMIALNRAWLQIKTSDTWKRIQQVLDMEV
jgi:hypothetical protein